MCVMKIKELRIIFQVINMLLYMYRLQLNTNKCFFFYFLVSLSFQITFPEGCAAQNFLVSILTPIQSPYNAKSLIPVFIMLIPQA